MLLLARDWESGDRLATTASGELSVHHHGNGRESIGQPSVFASEKTSSARGVN